MTTGLKGKQLEENPNISMTKQMSIMKTFLSFVTLQDNFLYQFFLGQRTVIEPKKDQMWDTLKGSFCPSLSIKSFTAIITMIDIAFYLITLLWDGIDTSSSEFLKPKSSTLEFFGSRVPYLMKNKFQVWRFLTPVFLHANFMHLAFNILSQLIFGSLIEKQIGTQKMMISYFFCAIGGNLFGALVNNSIAVGASTSITGLVGVFVAHIVVNWKRLDSSDKSNLMCVSGVIIFFNVLAGFMDNFQQEGKSLDGIDNYGHLGGLIVGMFIGMVLVKPVGGNPNKYEKQVENLGKCLWGGFFVIGFVLFYLR